jgi:methionyl-tRNA formyltransferase
MNKDLRIIYMGTPDFAVPSLDVLVAHGYQVVAVITAPDKPKGRGQKMSFSPVKEAALKHNIPVLQPTNLKSPEFLEELASYKANLQIVVAFRMLPEAVWNMPEIGTFNLHGSLLPQYRGAAPINWAIINGEKETGVTTFFLKHEIDTGNILFQEKETITEEDDAGSLYQRLMIKGAGLVLKTVQAIEKGDYQPQPQDETKEIKHAPKIFKETCEINWNQEADQVRNFIRGLSPYPAAWTNLRGTNFKIYKTEKAIGPKEIYAPGELVTDNKTFILIKTADRWLSIMELQAEGKRRMSVEEFLRGNQI